MKTRVVGPDDDERVQGGETRAAVRQAKQSRVWRRATK